MLLYPLLLCFIFLYLSLFKFYIFSVLFLRFVAAARAFGFWLDFTLVIYVTIVVLSFFVMQDSGGNVGLAITQAMSLTGNQLDNSQPY
jgi:hypothetical protein